MAGAGQHWLAITLDIAILGISTFAVHSGRQHPGIEPNNKEEIRRLRLLGHA